jgi:hypothetical protein
MSLKEMSLDQFVIACPWEDGAKKASKEMERLGYGYYSPRQITLHLNRLRSQGIDLEKRRAKVIKRLQRIALESPKARTR